jgi:(1->4)-alpha-D-glucan 1-alpha-D-glucosylmutase
MTTIPLATYRIQFNPQFRFSDAVAIISYLEHLGITHLYASPIFGSRRKSQHGYDVIDPTRIDEELGGAEEFEDLLIEVASRTMGWIQDIVPNHMAFDSQNSMLMDVLENGSASPFREYFDIDWNHPYESLRGKVLAPFLGKFYGECLENGEIQITYGERGFKVAYYDLRFPLRIESYDEIISYDLRRLKETLGEASSQWERMQGVVASVRSVGNVTNHEERRRQVAYVKETLWDLYTTNNALREHLDRNLKTFNGEKGNPESFNRLDDLLSQQLFRLSFWKVATEEINYRRFFNINQLISVRVEQEEVFTKTQSFILKLLWQDKFQGIRVDHVDGLYDPELYLRRLREAAPQAYLVVEKILHPDEDLPSSWPIDGTTGYDFMNFANGLFCAKEHDKRFEKIYTKFIRRLIPYEDLVADKKRLIIGRHMAGDIDLLAHALKALSSNSRFARDFTLYGLRRALVELLAQFPVYRTYVNTLSCEDRDRLYMEEALRTARKSAPALQLELDFIGRFLLLQFPGHASTEEKQRWLHFVMRFQQLTGPLMAKGFEDTTLYIYNKLISLNEVGGSPRRFGVSPLEFHHFNKKRAAQWPTSMNATSTHDSKRGEDVRARVNVLSELPEEWDRRVTGWKKMNARKKTASTGRAIPDPNDEYFYYQTLIGVLPFDSAIDTLFVERIKAYMLKAVREAKVHTAWLTHDEEYEQGFLSFIEETLRTSPDNFFLQDLLPFQKRVAFYGIFNSLSQTVLKCTCPGVPDLYQGTELWDLSLVDPDNRRPVDFGARLNSLLEIKEQARQEPARLLGELLASREDGRIKLFVTHTLLQLRHAQQLLFQRGEYIPLTARGEHKNNLITFARHADDAWSLTVLPRLLTQVVTPPDIPLGERVWGSTHIRLPDDAPKRWTNVFTQQSISADDVLPVGHALLDFPVAVLRSARGPEG